MFTFKDIEPGWLLCLAQMRAGILRTRTGNVDDTAQAIEGLEGRIRRRRAVLEASGFTAAGIPALR